MSYKVNTIIVILILGSNRQQLLAVHRTTEVRRDRISSAAGIHHPDRGGRGRPHHRRDHRHHHVHHEGQEERLHDEEDADTDG